MELGKFHDFKIHLRQDNLFSENSADNTNPYSFQYIDDDRASTKIAIFLLDGNEKVVVSAILGGAKGASGIHSTCAVVDNDRILLCVSNLIYCLELPTLKLLWRTEADDATCFEIQKIPEGYIIHGEMQISRLDKSGKIVWSNFGADIFTTPDGTDGFEVSKDAIKVRDWNGKLYKFDMNGKTQT